MNKSVLSVMAIMATLMASGWAEAGNRGACLTTMDANRDGLVTREEVQALRESHFTTADRNGDGYLAADELYGLPGRPPWGTMSGHRLFLLDGDRDGRLSKKEFTAFVPPRLAAMGLTEERGVPVIAGPWMGHGPGRHWGRMAW